MVYNTFLSNVYFLFVQLHLFIIRVNPDCCSPQIVRINEVLLYIYVYGLCTVYTYYP
jgi:hypothetical protein